MSDIFDTINKDEKNYGSSEGQISFKTGFDCFDYLNCGIDIVEGQKIFSPGLNGGKIVTIIGKSGSAKTTFAIQAAGNIIKKYDESQLFFLDFECSSSPQRIKSITGLTDEEFHDKVSVKTTGIYTETILTIASAIKKAKLEHQKELMTENKEGIIGEDGKPIKILPPTVIIVDSLATVMPKDIAGPEELSGQMSATAMAKANTQLFKRLVPICMEGNIIAIFINHINAKINATMMPTQAQTLYLSTDESLPGFYTRHYGWVVNKIN